MKNLLTPVVDAVQARFPVTVREFRGEITLVVPPERLLEVARFIQEDQDFDMLEQETAVDYWPQLEPRFHVVYHLYSMKRNTLLGLRVPLNGNAPVIPSLEGIYPNANWFEREIWDMFGIWFEGHSDMRRILMPQDWKGHPLRKDYPLGYEEVQFTFNHDQLQVKKPAPQE